MSDYPGLCPICDRPLNRGGAHGGGFCAPAMKYTQITFATPRARVEYAEASLEVKAREVVAAAAFDNLGRLADALDDLIVEVEELDRARAAEEASRAPVDPLVVEMRKRVAAINLLIEEQRRTADLDDRAGMRHREEEQVKALGRLVIAADSLDALDALASETRAGGRLPNWARNSPARDA